MKTLRNRLFCFSLLVGVLFSAQNLFAQLVDKKGSEYAEIKGKLGVKIPLDLAFTDMEGRSVQLRDYFGKGKPVILSMNYYSCPMMCGVQLQALVAGLKDPALGLQLQKDFQVVTVSIHPKETPPMARAKRNNFIQHLQPKTPLSDQDWPFLTGTQDSIQALASALEFQYWYNEEANQYVHAAGMFVFTEDGRLSRILYGSFYGGETLRLSLVEASKGRLGSPLDKAKIVCYGYDPNTKSYAMRWMFVMRIAATLTVVALVIFLGILWRREWRGKRKS